MRSIISIILVLTNKKHTSKVLEFYELSFEPNFVEFCYKKRREVRDFRRPRNAFIMEVKSTRSCSTLNICQIYLNKGLNCSKFYRKIVEYMTFEQEKRITLIFSYLWNREPKSWLDQSECSLRASDLIGRPRSLV